MVAPFASTTLNFLATYLRSHDAGQLLDNIPPYQDLDWKDNLPGAPGRALALGTRHDVDILVCVVQNGDKPAESRYFMKHPDSSSVKAITTDDVCDGADLTFPFVCLQGTSKSEKRNFSLLTKFYFSQAGIVDEAMEVALKDFAKRMHHVLELINFYMREHRVPKPRASIQSQTTESSDEEEQYEGQQREQLEQEIESVQSNQPKQKSPTRKQKAKLNNYDIPPINQILESLVAQDAEDLLDVIPPVTDMTFEPQDVDERAASHKLFFATHSKADRSIYVFLRPSNGKSHHEVVFRQEGRRGVAPQQLSAETAISQNLQRPFDKLRTWPIESSVKARISLMIKFYFGWQGLISQDVLLRETVDFSRRLKSALTHIDEKIKREQRDPSWTRPDYVNPVVIADIDNAFNELEDSDESDEESEIELGLPSPLVHPSKPHPPPSTATITARASEPPPKPQLTRHESPLKPPPQRPIIPSSSSTDTLPNNHHRNHHHHPFTLQKHQQPSTPGTLTRHAKRKRRSTEAEDLRTYLTLDEHYQNQLESIDDKLAELRNEAASLNTQWHAIKKMKRENLEVFRGRSARFGREDDEDDDDDGGGGGGSGDGAAS
ncbi:hypothetical protein BU24DRAFT_496958 [Aaosphaeria arxii CBS 175.79]|uniref:Uncharacterized protein n=1 Tax=Aaosphaeria arxii CBS 175.79 TaxID=1450172 RepID=A0A6A5XBN6_9PLEO|nr:uncharacterized protein BU24DRAFT_496958 [Aaosphaeria arxii CBS 175.79]KAF2010194.1 hypothetical protein BU24DRAFT_496958 [Aaosphaeria arxii CBS 175.79]